MNVRKSASIYFFLQGFGVIGWWVVLFFVPASRRYFQLGAGKTVLPAFWLPDLFLLAFGSLAVGGLCFYESKLTPFAAWFVTGLISYAALYCLAFALLDDTGWLGVTLMLPAMLWSGNFAIALSPTTRDLMFRRSSVAPLYWILVKTFAQIVVVWSLILVIFPLLIVRLETKLGIPQFTFTGQKLLAIVIFPFVSLIGLSGSYTMAKIGRGTPLPLDTASKLVISGIYSFVRNPMAISGIGQGLLVGVFLGSPLVLLYALMGGFIWQIIFRPLEEADLLKNFGAEYENYRQNVKCWIPRLKVR